MITLGEIPDLETNWAMSYQPEPPYLAAYLDKMSTFGIDIDTHDFETYRATIEACERVGRVVDYRTEHGWHFKVYLKKEVEMWEAFWLRYKCGDDYHRLVRDMLKALLGMKHLDVLFDLKTVKRKSIFKE